MEFKTQMTGKINETRENQIVKCRQNLTRATLNGGGFSVEIALPQSSFGWAKCPK